MAFPQGGPSHWGPEITFTPAFADGPIALFGRADFFGFFSITFEDDPTQGKVFHLDY